VKPKEGKSDAAVQSFDYLSVLLSIVIGLAVTQVLQGLSGLILTRIKVKLYLPTLIWAGLALLIAIQTWWASFGLHLRVNWTFLTFRVSDFWGKLQLKVEKLVAHVAWGDYAESWTHWFDLLFTRNAQVFHIRTDLSHALG